MAQRPVRFALLDADGEVIETIPLTVKDASNPFSKGSVGFFASGKLGLHGVNGDTMVHQVTCSIVEANSADEALAAVALARRSKKAELADKIRLLREQMKLSA